MSRNKKALGSNDGQPTLANILGTDDPERQVALVQNLVKLAVERQVSFTVLFKPQTGQYQLLHSDNAAYAELKAALDAGHEYLSERRIRAQMEQQNGGPQSSGHNPAILAELQQPDSGSPDGGPNPTGPTYGPGQQEHDTAGGEWEAGSIGGGQ